MAWPNPFVRKTDNTRSAWDYTFQLTPEHLSEAQMKPMKHSYDVLAEKALSRLNEISPPTRVASVPKSGREGSVQTSNEEPATSKRDLYLLLKQHADEDEILSQLWKESNTVPSWVDWEQIARGQDCFYRYGGPALTGLAFQSLLGGMGAARVVETLSRTGGFSTKVARHRLFETTQHILQCTQSLQSIQPGGAGFASSIRVRLLHAAVRQRIMKLAQQRPSYYDVEAFGIPINDLDCIATIGTFSATLIWLSLPRQGIWMTQQEIVDYIALWRYIAYLTGTPTEPFETPAKARCVMEVLLYYEVHPTQTSRILANNIIKCLVDQPPSFASVPFLQANARFLNGDKLCDALGIGRPSLYYWALAVGQCLFFMAICYTYRSIPYLDRRKIAALRKIFWKVIVENKQGLGEETTFEFKYIPDLSKRTQMEDAPLSALKQSGIERRNLQALIFASAFFALAGYCVYRVLIMMGKRSTGFWIS